MCGIFAYLNFMHPKTRAEVVNILLQGLERMEYRGYDSAGIAIDDGNQRDRRSDEIRVIRCRGKVGDLKKHILNENKDLDMTFPYMMHCGIAHTRWATHGEPTDVNSHPQRSDDSNMFVCVHNGIITNYRELKQLLVSKGYQFESQTDTEVVVKLAKYIHDKYPRLQLRGVVEIVTSLLEGAFALVFKSRLFPGQLVATRRGSPLVVGIRCDWDENPSQFDVQMNKARMFTCDDTLNLDGQTPTGDHTPKSGKSFNGVADLANLSLNSTAQSFAFDRQAEYFFASDASAIVEHTRQVLYLEDDDIAAVAYGKLAIHRVGAAGGPEAGGVRIVEELNMQMDQIMRGAFATFMQKEIFEQTESVVNTMRGRLQPGGEIQLGGLKHHLHELAGQRRIVFVACGTSYNSAIASRMLTEELCGLPVQVELASDFMDRAVPIGRADVCVFLSQSGETADSLAALRYCKRYGALLLGITNTVGSTICRETDCGIHLNAGPEIGVASTKAYTSQIIALVMLAVCVAQSQHRHEKRCEQIVRGLRRLSDQVAQVLKLEPRVLEIARQVYRERSMLVMGRGYNFATCLEGALKIKELSYMHCEGILSGELKHGPLAMVDDKQCIIMVICSDDVYKKSINAFQQVLARGGRPIIIADSEVAEADLTGARHVIRVPKTVDCLQNILTVIPLQLMAYHIADFNGFNVDRPRNLAKSVTVE